MDPYNYTKATTFNALSNWYYIFIRDTTYNLYNIHILHPLAELNS
jgi:hypothetical protein